MSTASEVADAKGVSTQQSERRVTDTPSAAPPPGEQGSWNSPTAAEGGDWPKGLYSRTES